MQKEIFINWNEIRKYDKNVLIDYCNRNKIPLPPQQTKDLLLFVIDQFQKKKLITHSEVSSNKEIVRHDIPLISINPRSPTQFFLFDIPYQKYSWKPQKFHFLFEKIISKKTDKPSNEPSNNSDDQESKDDISELSNKVMKKKNFKKHKLKEKISWKSVFLYIVFLLIYIKEAMIILSVKKK